jgi:rubrerythrin
LANKRKEVFVCAVCSVVILPAPGVCPPCQKFLDRPPKPGKGK